MPWRPLWKIRIWKFTWPTMQNVVLTVAGDNAAKSSEILDNVESCMSEHQNVYCHSGNSEEVHHAHDAGLSFGKYQAWQVLQDLDPDITLEEVQDMTMSEIRDLIRKYSQEKSQEKSQDNDQSSEAGKHTGIPESGYQPGIHRRLLGHHRGIL